MGKHTGHRWHLSCRCDDACAWSRHVTIPGDADTEAALLVILRAHADQARHGRRIEGVAIAPDTTVLVLKHP